MTIKKIPKIEYVPIWKVQAHPDNPRFVRDAKYKKLVKSIKEFPDMFAVRPLIVTEDLVVLGGNMRLRASKDAGLTEVPIIVTKFSIAQQKEFVIKDNVGFGEWDWEMIANQWDTEQLVEWGMDIYTPVDEDKEEEQVVKKDNFRVVVVFDNLETREEWYEKLIGMGLNCLVK
jgi:ParB-like chromosome segregation protein Spo0J